MHRRGPKQHLADRLGEQEAEGQMYRPVEMVALDAELLPQRKARSGSAARRHRARASRCNGRPTSWTQRKTNSMGPGCAREGELAAIKAEQPCEDQARAGSQAPRSSGSIGPDRRHEQHGEEDQTQSLRKCPIGGLQHVPTSVTCCKNVRQRLAGPAGREGLRWPEQRRIKRGEVDCAEECPASGSGSPQGRRELRIRPPSAAPAPAAGCAPAPRTRRGGRGSRACAPSRRS